MTNTASQGPLPIVISITGHTDVPPDAAPRVASRVRAFFDELRSKYPHSPLELLTPLAEGADRIAARVALDAGIALTVVLPLEETDYKTDFGGADSIREFDELKQRAARVFVLPRAASASRPECYARVGAYGVQHAHVLLALWDGTGNGKTGGTSEIVRFALEGVPRAYSSGARLLTPPETAVVHHIVTPRVSSAMPPVAFESRWLAAGGLDAPAARALLAEMLGSIDTFNRHAIESDVAGKTLYECADALAIRFQRKSTRAIKTLFIVGWLSIVAFESFTDLKITIAVIPYVLLFLMAYALYVWMNSRGLDDRHLDYRSLAEALRVQSHWRSAGITDSVADHYMRYRIPESEWIRKALLVMELHLDSQAAAAPATAGDVRETWVKSQHDFFTRARRRDHTLHHRLDRVAGILMGASMLLLVGLIALSIPELMEAEPTQHTAAEGAAEEHDDNHWLVVLIGVLAAGAGAFHGYGEKRALEAQEKRYARMMTIYESALAHLQDQGNGAPASQDVLRELGREALEENADWVMLHRDRPLEPPGPGH